MDLKSSHLRGEGELALLAGTLLLLAVGCLSERTLGEGPVPERMVPDFAVMGTSVSVEIQGRDFYPGVRVSYRGESRHAGCNHSNDAIYPSVPT